MSKFLKLTTYAFLGISVSVLPTLTAIVFPGNLAFAAVAILYACVVSYLLFAKGGF